MMEIEGQLHKETRCKPQVTIEFGMGGHENEYVLRTFRSKYGMAEEMPAEWERKLRAALGDERSVLNRGHRIEIMPRHFNRTSETDRILREAVQSLVGEDYEIQGN